MSIRGHGSTVWVGRLVGGTHHKSSDALSSAIVSEVLVETGSGS